MSQIPRDPSFDSTLAMWREGYDFIWNRCRRLRSDLFLTRVMGKKTVCIHGREAAELFYDESRFQRASALPRRVVTSLFGKGAVHTLDGAAHRQRKAAFLCLMTPANLERLMLKTAEHWQQAVLRWEMLDEVVLFDEVQQLLTGAVCAWAGVPLHESELPRRARDLGRMVDAFGGAGARLWQGKLARARSEHWIARCITKVRRGRLLPDAQSALYVMAHHRELDGDLLDVHTAAVELLNVIRPTVAIAWYIAFAALALHEHPEAREALAREPPSDGAGAYADLFMQEVRRFYPFTPYLGAKVRTPFQWRGHSFAKGTLVLLDIHGTNHDPALWDEPERFRPERFQNWNADAFNFMPQGGGTRNRGHRCPGEWITMHNIALALHFLTRCMRYEVVADQDLSIDLSRMPTRPRSGFVIRNVQATEALAREAPHWPSRTAAHECAAASRTGEIRTGVGEPAEQRENALHEGGWL